jgi:hypothetical protein
MATGRLRAEEYELLMPKILCGYPLEEAVPPLADPSAGELEEADAMLQALIQQWEVLKNTSMQGLREGFLQRNGKLLGRNGDLVLQVEKSAIDVLLDYLPWNLSIIKLPWMEKLLKVEWR